VSFGLSSRSTQTGTATNVAVHRVLYAPIHSTESRSLTRARSQPCVSRSALSPGGTPKDIRANTDTHCWLRPRLERPKGALDLKIIAPARAVRSYERGTSESGDKEIISASNMLIPPLLLFICMSLRKLVILMTRRAYICDLWISTHGAGSLRGLAGKIYLSKGAAPAWDGSMRQPSNKKQQERRTCRASTERDRVE
jgi:hypothetical protein